MYIMYIHTYVPVAIECWVKANLSAGEIACHILVSWYVMEGTVYKSQQFFKGCDIEEVVGGDIKKP